MELTILQSDCKAFKNNVPNRCDSHGLWFLRVATLPIESIHGECPQKHPGLAPKERTKDNLARTFFKYPNPKAAFPGYI